MLVFFWCNDDQNFSQKEENMSADLICMLGMSQRMRLDIVLFV